MILIIFILFIFVISIKNLVILMRYLNKLEKEYLILFNKCNDLKDLSKIKNEIYEYNKCELTRTYQQLKLYENDELERRNITINNINYKKNNLFIGKRILIGTVIDDHLIYLRKILQKMGIIVDVVSTSRDVYQKISYSSKIKYDLIFIDEIFKEENELKNIKKLQNKFAFHTPIILLTLSKLNSQKKISYFCAKYNVDGIIEKNFDESFLITLLKKFL